MAPTLLIENRVDPCTWKRNTVDACGYSRTGEGEPDQEEGTSRVEQARRRARRDRLERGLEELQKLRPSKPRARVSVSEPEARRMRQA